MRADCKGALAQINKSYKSFVHNGKSMTKAEVKAVLEYAISKGYEHTGLLSNEEIDGIIKSINPTPMTTKTTKPMTQPTEKICFSYDGSKEAIEALKWVNETFGVCYQGHDGYIYSNDNSLDAVFNQTHRLVPPAEFLRLVKGESEPKWKVGDECLFEGDKYRILAIDNNLAWVVDEKNHYGTVELKYIRPVRKSLREEIHEYIKDAYNCFIPENGIERIIQLVKERGVEG